MNFRIITICFIIESIVFALLCHYLPLSWWFMLIPLLGYKLMIIMGSANIQANFYIKAHCSAETTEKVIAISFDDGPHPEFTPKVLSVLDEYQVPATFFVIGKNIQGNESIVRKIHEAGHILGNHTWSHGFFIDFKGKSAFREELNSTQDAVYNIIRKRMKFFRPPYGVTTPHLAAAAKAENYHVIGWNIRSLDTTSDAVDKIAKRVISQVRPGAVILFHDTSAKTVEVLRQTLNFAKENGFKIVSTGELLKLNAYQ